ncbi:MAG: DUF285 domain-containing protein [Xanthomonadales bacterium]|nr:DUF285 domain-containing protein [Xanthomonadales bacterium]
MVTGDFLSGMHLCAGTSSLVTSGIVNIEAGAVVYFQSPKITLNLDFNVSEGASLITSSVVGPVAPLLLGPSKVKASIGDVLVESESHICEDFEDGVLAITPLDTGVINISTSNLKFVSALLIFIGLQTAFAAPSDHFVTTWKTDNPGTSNTTSITVPMVGGPYDVDWDNDGTFDEFSLTGMVTHDYGVAGTNTIRIKGSFDSIKFSGGVDKQKIISLDQWGTQRWKTMQGAFSGTTNLLFPAIDTPDFSAVTDMSLMFSRAVNANPNTSNWNTQAVKSMQGMFSGASSANPDTSNWNTSRVETMDFMFSSALLANPDTSNWDTAAVKSMFSMFSNATSANPDTVNWNTESVVLMSFMFRGASSANPDVSGWNTTAVTHMIQMFKGAISFDQDIGAWDVTALKLANNMFADVTLSTANYESLLIGWEAQLLTTGVTFGGGNSTYCSPQAAAARAQLITANSWVITDGGKKCLPEGACNLIMVAGVTEEYDATYEACELLSIDPAYTVAAGANLTLASGWAVDIQPGFTVEKGATLNIKTCGLSLCEVNPSPMPYGCHSCVDQICDVDPSCCGVGFSQACLDKVGSVCGLVCD